MGSFNVYLSIRSKMKPKRYTLHFATPLPTQIAANISSLSTSLFTMMTSIFTKKFWFIAQKAGISTCSPLHRMITLTKPMSMNRFLIKTCSQKKYALYDLKNLSSWFRLGSTQANRLLPLLWKEWSIFSPAIRIFGLTYCEKCSFLW